MMKPSKPQINPIPEIKRSGRYYLIHLFVIVAFFFYESGFAYFFGGSSAPFINYLFFYLLNLILFFFNANVIVTKALKSRQFYWVLFLFIILELLGYCLLYILLSNSLNKAWTKEIYYLPSKFDFLRAVWRGVYFIGLSMGYSFAKYSIAKAREVTELKLVAARVDKEKVDLENKMLLAENALLESQIKTHLLFNTLSYVYDKTMDLPGGPAEAVLILNEVMRYSLKKVPADGKMPVNEEIEHIRNIVRLGELRHDEGLFIEIETVNVDNPEYRIIASMLSTFVENMFKYGDLKDPITPAMVSAKVEGGTFSFRATNKKTGRSGQESHKIGLDNVRRRLQYAYDSFSLIVTDNPDEFIIDLKVPV